MEGEGGDGVAETVSKDSPEEETRRRFVAVYREAAARWTCLHRFSGGTPEGRARVIAREPMGRMGRPEEIAAAALWLCSDEAAFVAGHAMVIDGGQTVGS